MSRSKLMGLALSLPALVVIAGCACGKTRCAWATEPTFQKQEVSLATYDLPTNAKPGECYAKIFIPEQFETRMETVCTREATERLEIIPARYEWVEEKILVKEASTQLDPVPAQFASRPRRIQTDPGHTGWHAEKTVRCVSDTDPKCAKEANVRWAPEMYCLVRHDPSFQTIETEVVEKPPTVRETVIPAEYQTVRRQKLVAPATTRRIPIPAEYAQVPETVKVADSRIEWRRVPCAQAQQAKASDPTEAFFVSYTEPAAKSEEKPDR